MSILLNSIDCPCLTEECRENLIEKYSIHTINDFILWLNKLSTTNNNEFSSNTIQCIQTCIIAHTAKISPRKTHLLNIIRVNYELFDKKNFFENYRHIIIFYESFNQYQWNELFNNLLIRLILNNSLMKIYYFNTNVSLFDMKYFNEKYSSINKDNLFDLNYSFDLEIFEKQLNTIENNDQLLNIIIIDDFFSLIKPYLNLERRIKNYILQLIYRLNRLAQKHSLLILTGLIFPYKNRMNTTEDNHYLLLDSFPVDKYLIFQSMTNNENEIHVRLIDEKTHEQQTIIHLNDWGNM